MGTRRIWLGLAAGLLIFAACGSDGDDDATSAARDVPADDPGRTNAVAAGTDGDIAGEATEEGAARDEAAGSERALSDEPTDEQDVGLQAGSVDDNDMWEDYLRYREAFARLGLPFDDLPVDGRRVLTVVDGDDRPVLDAEIVIETGDGRVTLRTGSDGRAVFLAPPGDIDGQQSATSSEATVTHGSATTSATIGPEPRQTIVLDGAARDGTIRLDVLFLVDATGSMGDEIERLKANMVGVAEKIAESPAQPDVRFALTSYRDLEDEYLTRTVDFASDVDAFVESLRGLVADGGGDTPEALNEAFAEAVDAPRWRTGDDVVRLAFLIADAPPHVGRGTSYVESIRAAAAQGIRVFPIASSGTEDQAEYVFRQIAQATLGRFVFLSYGADGAALGSGTNIGADDYDVLALDELIVRLVEEQLAPLTER